MATTATTTVCNGCGSHFVVTTTPGPGGEVHHRAHVGASFSIQAQGLSGDTDDGTARVDLTIRWRCAGCAL